MDYSIGFSVSSHVATGSVILCEGKMMCVGRGTSMSSDRSILPFFFGKNTCFSAADFIGYVLRCLVSPTQTCEFVHLCVCVCVCVCFCVCMFVCMTYLLSLSLSLSLSLTHTPCNPLEPIRLALRGLFLTSSSNPV